MLVNLNNDLKFIIIQQCPAVTIIGKITINYKLRPILYKTGQTPAITAVTFPAFKRTLYYKIMKVY